MLIREARWLGAAIAAEVVERVSPMLDVGSGDAETRAWSQPWIDREIFEPALRRGLVVHHLDRHAGPGVDLAGDLLDAGFVATLAAAGYRSILCANLLEHVEDASFVAASLSRALAPGGLLFVSCPFRFPYHPDPIDTLLRPDVAELAALFPETRLLRGELVPDERMITFTARGIARRPLRSATELVRRLLRRSGDDRRALARAGSSIGWLARRLVATCVVLERR